MIYIEILGIMLILLIIFSFSFSGGGCARPDPNFDDEPEIEKQCGTIRNTGNKGGLPPPAQDSNSNRTNCHI